VAMRDDGLGGDEKAGDGIWSFRTEVPIGVEIQYKYTNSGTPGQWVPGEEFPSHNRTLTITAVSSTPRIIKDIFGQ